MPDIDVQVTEAAWQDDSEDPQSMTRRVIGALEEHLQSALKGKDFTVRFASDADVRALNLQFRGKDEATNVLSFPATPIPGQESPSLGDIILARETIVGEAATQGKTVRDHTSHLVIHGVLHLLGYDHDTDEHAGEMEQVERDVLAILGIDDPYEPESSVEGSHVH